jgi:DNA mismatch repair protein MutS2
VDRHSRRLLEFERIANAIAERALSEGGRSALDAWRPIADRASLARETGRLAEAIRRVREPGEWCHVGPGALPALLERAEAEGLDGLSLVAIRRWLDAAVQTRSDWRDDAMRERYPELTALADQADAPKELHARLTQALDDDGAVRDAASPALGKLRRTHREGERDLESRLERWARPFGAEAHVTRHGERFVVLVPGAGFPRRRAIVHDVSGSGHSLYAEPLELCGENNRLIELRAAAQEEERRILLALVRETLDRLPALETLAEALTHLDTLRARALWSLELGGIAIIPGGGKLRLVGARHPLLAIAAHTPEAREREVVPLDLELGGEGRLLLVSGPNMGGKTVLLKTVGLAVLMAHAALPVLAREGSEVPEIDALIVDLGDEQSVDQGLSTFAAHLKVLAEMAERSGPRTLVLCDELGAGTDPEEGAALGRALIEHVVARGTWGIVTTHLGSLKRVAGDVSGVLNGSLEFDVETLTSKYRFLPGVPGASHALSVAERLGFPRAVLERAKSLTPDEVRVIERLTAELSQAHQRLIEQKETLARAEADARAAATAHREAEEEIRAQWTERRRTLTRDTETLIARTRALWQTLDQEARKREAKRADLAPWRDEIARIESDVKALAPPLPEPAVAPLPSDRLVAGQRVRVADLGVEAVLVSGPDEEGRVMLRRGSWTIQSHASRLTAAEDTPSGASGGGVSGTWAMPEDAPGIEVHLRGMDVEEALSAVDRALDRAVIAGLLELRIVHGVGKGVLRSAVERHLKGHPQVAEQRLGQFGEGGRGVTVAKLR